MVQLEPFEGMRMKWVDMFDKRVENVYNMYMQFDPIYYQFKEMPIDPK